MNAGAKSAAAAPKADAPLRLFIALWPGAAVRAALADSARGWTWPPRAALVRAPRLHLTLHFLGDVARDRIARLRAAIALPMRPFDITLARAALWPGGIAVLEPDAVSAPLAQLHAALAHALRDCGLCVERRAFRPHVTLARRAAGSLPPAHIAPLDWRVDSYVLAASVGAREYEIVQRYPAVAGAPPLERSQRARDAEPLQ